MIIISIFYGFVLYQIMRVLFEKDNIWYRDPKFWLLIITLCVLTAATIV
jgi:hypothetical protein